jgi:hypothetical protein
MYVHGLVGVHTGCMAGIAVQLLEWQASVDVICCYISIAAITAITDQA